MYALQLVEFAQEDVEYGAGRYHVLAKIAASHDLKLLITRGAQNIANVHLSCH
jgi:hypothetical protein